jgi:hypothetical protein
MDKDKAKNLSLFYSTKYLTTEIVGRCFTPGSHNLVDKIICGNGFTTSFLKIAPNKKYQSNIIIVPNKRVVQSKQKSYIKDLSRNKGSIGFIYGDDSSDKVDFKRFDTMMFVVDSFLNYIDIIKKHSMLIDKILIDECHSMLIQSVFRNRLIGFTQFMTDTFSEKAIVSVTATPMLFQNANIKLLPTEIKQRIINVTEHQEQTIQRIKDDLKANKKVIVALHDARLLRKLADNKNVLSANIKVGTTLYQKILENVILKLNENSNLTIISSAGFEGFDVDNGINNIYIFEDRAFDYQTFYTQNIIQVIGRSRKGTNYIEWCRMSNRTRRDLMSKEAMIRKSLSKKISFEKKMTDSRYNFIPKFFDRSIDTGFGLITKLELNHEKYDLEKELVNADLKGLHVYDDYLKERGFVVNQLNEGSKRITLRSPSHKKAFKRVKANKEVLTRFNLFDDIRINLYQKEKTEYYIKAYEVFLRRKYWNEDKMRFTLTKDEAKYLPKDELDEIKGYDAIKNSSWINDCVKYISAVSKHEAQKRMSRFEKDYIKWVVDFEKNIEDRYVRLIMAISQSKIRFPKKYRNHRDFNLSTEVSISILKDVCSKFKKDVTEVDIVSCNVRIIYAYCGLDLPNDFYGDNKVNKKPINMLINKLSKEFPQEYKVDVPKYKKNRVQELRAFGFDEKVISFLMDNFWDKPKDSLYNFCAYHEQNICNNVMSDFIGYSESVILEDSSYRDSFKNTRYVRRHDSILIFESPIVMDEVIENFTYLEHNNWFNNDRIKWLKLAEKRLENTQNV